MTAEQKAALKWLDHWAEPSATHARALKAMLAEPRLPKEPSEEALQAMRNSNDRVNAFSMYRALYAHLTAPRDQLEEIRRYGT